MVEEEGVADGLVDDAVEDVREDLALGVLVTNSKDVSRLQEWHVGQGCYSPPGWCSS